MYSVHSEVYMLCTPLWGLRSPGGPLADLHHAQETFFHCIIHWTNSIYGFMEILTGFTIIENSCNYLRSSWFTPPSPLNWYIFMCSNAMRFDINNYLTENHALFKFRNDHRNWMLNSFDNVSLWEYMTFISISGSKYHNWQGLIGFLH